MSKARGEMSAAFERYAVLLVLEPVRRQRRVRGLEHHALQVQQSPDHFLAGAVEVGPLGAPLRAALRRRAAAADTPCPSRWQAAGAMAVIVFLQVLVLVVMLAAFSKTAYLTIPPKGLTLHWFQVVLQDPEYLSAG